MTYNLMYLDVHSAGVAMGRGRWRRRGTTFKGASALACDFSSDRAAETVIVSLAAQLAFERGNISQAKQYIGHVAHRLPHSEAWLDIYFAGYEPMLRLLARDQGLASRPRRRWSVQRAASRGRPRSDRRQACAISGHA